MKFNEIRNWIGIYFLLLTSILGGYIILFKGGPLLPIDENEAMDSFKMIIPTLVSQVVVIFKWFSSEWNNDETKNENFQFPNWLVKLPLIVTSTLIFITIIFLILGNYYQEDFIVSINDETFKNILIFSLSILNATSIIIISKVFFRKDA